MSTLFNRLKPIQDNKNLIFTFVNSEKNLEDEKVRLRSCKPTISKIEYLPSIPMNKIK